MRLFVLFILVFLCLGMRGYAQDTISIYSEIIADDSVLVVAEDSFSQPQIKCLQDTCDTIIAQMSEPRDSVILFDTVNCWTASIQTGIEGVNSNPEFPVSATMGLKNGKSVRFHSIPKINLVGLSVSMPIKSLPIIPRIGIASIKGETMLGIIGLDFSQAISRLQINGWCIYAPTSRYKVHTGLTEITVPVKSFTTGIFAEWHGYLSSLKGEEKAPFESEFVLGPVIERSFGKQGNFALAFHGGINVLDRNEYELSAHIAYTFNRIKISTSKKARGMHIAPVPIPPIDTARHGLPLAHRSDTAQGAPDADAQHEFRNAVNSRVAFSKEDTSSLNRYDSRLQSGIVAGNNSQMIAIPEEKKQASQNETIFASTFSKMDSVRRPTTESTQSLRPVLSSTAVDGIKRKYNLKNKCDSSLQTNRSNIYILITYSSSSSSQDLFGRQDIYYSNQERPHTRESRDAYGDLGRRRNTVTKEAPIEGVPIEVILLVLFCGLRRIRRANSS
jgi:hypothetical protein